VVTLTVIVVIVVLLLLKNFDVASLFQPGFTDSQIRQVDQAIKDYYVNQMRTSPSALERREIANGSTTIEVQMIKVSAKRLEGFATISSDDEGLRRLGLEKISVPCETTMGTNSDQYIWKCQNK
jgi:hypothetical protein